MARPIKETPVLKGEAARKFLAEKERTKDKKATPAELQKIRESYAKLTAIANFR